MDNLSISQNDIDRQTLNAEILSRIEAVGGICEAIYARAEQGTATDEPLLALADAACFAVQDLARKYPY